MSIGTILFIIPIVDDVIDWFYNETIYSYWFPERGLVENKLCRYGEALPNRLGSGATLMNILWNLTQVLGYLRSLTACRFYQILWESYDTSHRSRTMEGLR